MQPSKHKSMFSFKWWLLRFKSFRNMIDFKKKEITTCNEPPWRIHCPPCERPHSLSTAPLVCSVCIAYLRFLPLKVSYFYFPIRSPSDSFQSPIIEPGHEPFQVQVSVLCLWELIQWGVLLSWGLYLEAPISSHSARNLVIAHLISSPAKQSSPDSGC